MNLEHIMLNEIGQTEKDRYYMVLPIHIWDPKKLNSQKHRLECWLPGAGGWGKWEDVHQRVQISIYKMKLVLEIECTV